MRTKLFPEFVPLVDEFQKYEGGLDVQLLSMEKFKILHSDSKALQSRKSRVSLRNIAKLAA